MKSKVNVNVT